ncbi:MAG: DEAD/DEAH box helicase [Oligoflexia bacterium]|nr:DEAD/DEAH box helicase [Oligoflexia bacterium]
MTTSSASVISSASTVATSSITPSFQDLGLSSCSLAAISKKGLLVPTSIQIETIPLLLSCNKNIVAQSQTGTGKTAAFALPIMDLVFANSERLGHSVHQLKKGRGEESIRKVTTAALVLTPTRELALQVAEEIKSLKGERSLTVTAVYGGQSIMDQIRQLRRGVDIVIGTPGRVIDLLERKELNLTAISHLVLDEAYEMLNMGFWEQVEEIIKYVNSHRQILLFSATMPKRILDTVKKEMGDYHLVRAKNTELTTKLTEQIYFEVNPEDRLEAICRIIDMQSEFYGLIFCKTKLEVSELGQHLIDRGYDADLIHGDLSQIQREVILKKFRNRIITILVATDVAARGIDVSDLTHVINHSIPSNPEAYIHRIGRTGRAGKQGIAITFISPRERQKLALIKRISNAEIKRRPIPSPQDIIENKRQKIIAEISERCIKRDLEQGSGENIDVFLSLAQKLLSNNSDVEKLVSVLLQHSFGDALDISKYKLLDTFPRSASNLSESGRRSASQGGVGRSREGGSNIIRTGSNAKGTVRLFMALGKKDGIDKNKLVKILKQQSVIEESSLRSMQIFDKFSFITVPSDQGEAILDAYQKSSLGRGRPLVERAQSAEQSRPQERSKEYVRAARR